jgi:hypothetical protein
VKQFEGNFEHTGQNPFAGAYFPFAGGFEQVMMAPPVEEGRQRND